MCHWEGLDSITKASHSIKHNSEGVKSFSSSKLSYHCKKLIYKRYDTAYYMDKNNCHNFIIPNKKLYQWSMFMR